MRPKPFPVLRRRASLERTRPGVVQLGHHLAFDGATSEGKVARGDGTLELTGHAEVDTFVGEALRQPLRLKPTARGERRWTARIRADDVGDVRLALRVADDQ